MCRLPCPSAGRRTTLCVNNNVRKRSGSSRPWPQEMTDARQRPPSRFRSRRALPLSSTNPAAPAWSPAPDHRCAGERLLGTVASRRAGRPGIRSGGGGRAALGRGGLRAHPTMGLGVGPLRPRPETCRQARRHPGDGRVRRCRGSRRWSAARSSKAWRSGALGRTATSPNGTAGSRSARPRRPLGRRGRTHPSRYRRSSVRQLGPGLPARSERERSYRSRLRLGVPCAAPAPR